MTRIMIWAAVGLVVAVPVFLASLSPYLAYRDGVYIVAGFGGIFGMALLLLQPLLVAGLLPGIRSSEGRWFHRWLGGLIIVCIGIHVGGLYLTSPMDTLDALMLVAPTPFSIYGVTALGASLCLVFLIVFRRILRLRPSNWRLAHGVLALIVVISTVIHAVMIEGAMETVSKSILGITVVFAAIGGVVVSLRRRIKGTR